MMLSVQIGYWLQLNALTAMQRSSIRRMMRSMANSTVVGPTSISARMLRVKPQSVCIRVRRIPWEQWQIKPRAEHVKWLTLPLTRYGVPAAYPEHGLTHGWLMHWAFL